MFFITNKIDFFFMYSLIMESLLRQIFEQFDLRDPSNHIKAIIQTYCSPINVVAFFTIENGCKGTVHASFTNISSQYDENEENKENKGRVVLQVFRVSIFQTIYIQPKWNVDETCCSDRWYIPTIYTSLNDCSHPGVSNCGEITSYNYSELNEQLQKSTTSSMELYIVV